LKGPNSMVTFDQLSKTIKATHRQIWDDWYCGSNYVPARLQIEQSDQASGYSHSNNQILLAIPSGNLEDFDVLNVDGWPLWKIELVHELLHEWQMKMPCVVTPQAEELCRRHKPRDCGRGHDPDFFQAIIERSPYFEMTPEELIEKI